MVESENDGVHLETADTALVLVVTHKVLKLKAISTGLKDLDDVDLEWWQSRKITRRLWCLFEG